MRPRDRFPLILQSVPEHEKDAAALRLLRYLELMIELYDQQQLEDQKRLRERHQTSSSGPEAPTPGDATSADELTDPDAPSTLSYSV